MRRSEVILGIPQLAIYGLSEEWAVAAAMEQIWQLLADSLGRPPSAWFDSEGKRMYAAAIAIRTWFDLQDILREDDVMQVESRILGIRKPHAWSEVCFTVNGKAKASVCVLASFIRREAHGSNKMFSKVRDVWTAEDVNPELVEDVLAQHHHAKTEMHVTEPVLEHEANRLVDFNAAGLFYFRNYVRLARAAEWRENRGKPDRLNAERHAYFFGNVDDGETMAVRLGREGDSVVVEVLDPAGRRLFLSLATTQAVTIETPP